MSELVLRIVYDQGFLPSACRTRAREACPRLQMSDVDRVVATLQYARRTNRTSLFHINKIRNLHVRGAMQRAADTLFLSHPDMYRVLKAVGYHVEVIRASRKLGYFSHCDDEKMASAIDAHGPVQYCSLGLCIRCCKHVKTVRIVVAHLRGEPHQDTDAAGLSNNDLHALLEVSDFLLAPRPSHDDEVWRGAAIWTRFACDEQQLLYLFNAAAMHYSRFNFLTFLPTVSILRLYRRGCISSTEVWRIFVHKMKESGRGFSRARKRLLNEVIEREPKLRLTLPTYQDVDLLDVLRLDRGDITMAFMVAKNGNSLDTFRVLRRFGGKSLLSLLPWCTWLQRIWLIMEEDKHQLAGGLSTVRNTLAVARSYPSTAIPLAFLWCKRGWTDFVGWLKHLYEKLS